MKLAIFLLLAASLACGCSTPPASAQNASGAVVVDRPEVASEIAKKAVLQREPLFPVGKVRVTKTDKGWVVVVWDDPPSPGGSRIVRIEPDGQVSRIDK
jgi:hypothetical protein